MDKKPAEILKDAIERYRKPDGYEGYLVEAAWQLEQMGVEAWDALQEITLIPECELFVGTMVRLKGVPLHDRLNCLLEVAQNPDENVRERLLELTDEIPEYIRQKIVQELVLTQMEIERKKNGH